MDWYRDTDPRALEVFLEAQRSMTPAEKVRAVFDLTELALRCQEAGVRAQYPGIDKRELQLRCAARRYDRATMSRVFAWDPECPPKP